MKNREAGGEFKTERENYSPYNLKEGVIYDMGFLEFVCDKRGKDLTDFVENKKSDFGCQKKRNGYLLSKKFIEYLIGIKKRNSQNKRKVK